MKEIELKYGCNPNQKPARIYMADGGELPVEVVNGPPGLHQLHGRAQLLAAGARALAARRARRPPRASSTSRPPARPSRGPLSDEDRLAFFAEGELSPVASALRPRPRRGQALLLRRLGRDERGLRRDGGEAAPARGVRRRNRPPATRPRRWRFCAKSAGGTTTSCA